MVRIGFYSETQNTDVKGYLGLYRSSGIIDYVLNNKDLYHLFGNFFGKSDDWQNIDYTDENIKMILELFHRLKREGWEGNIVCFTDGEYAEIPSSFTMHGYDICSDSMYYSPLGDGFLLRYNIYPDFYTDLSYDEYSKYIEDINESGLFTSYKIAKLFSDYCNQINKKHRYCIESQDNWKPIAVFIYNSKSGSVS